MQLLKSFSLAYCFFFLFLLALMGTASSLLSSLTISEQATTVSANTSYADTLTSNSKLPSALK